MRIRCWAALRIAAILLPAVALATGAAARQLAQPASPASLYGELYRRVETSALFPDSKTFADAVAREPAGEILRRYQQQRPESLTALREFISDHFELPAAAPGAPTQSVTGAPVPLLEHIRALWPVLARRPAAPEANSSLLPLNHVYVVPGGRFRELYYWDSYFTMLGLARDGQAAAVRGMVENFADLLQRFGHIPNGTRTYYLSRSQPPVFYLMVGLTNPDSPLAFAEYLPWLRVEYAYWMRGAAQLRPGQARRHVVALPGGFILNRYWDARDTPRDESYREDLRVSSAALRAPRALYRDLRAAAESGWDFSSRWLRDPTSLASIETTAIVPIDLNSLLYGLERAIADGCAFERDRACADDFRARAAARRAAMNRYLWDPKRGRFLDYQWRRGERLNRPSAAMLYPLFVGLADQRQADQVAQAVRRELLAPGGLLTTPRATGQQWDAPNGWAPLQWIAVRGLNAYGHRAIARDIAVRWLHTVLRTYTATGRLLEKYDVLESRPGGGGEYPLQDGFGWTNGVTCALAEEYPDGLFAGSR